MEALGVYRAEFRASRHLDRPHVMVGVPAMAADDDDTAEYVSGLEAAADDQPSTDLDELEGFGPFGAPFDETHQAEGPMPDADPAELVEEVERFLRGD